MKNTMSAGDVGLVVFDPDLSKRGQYALEGGVLVWKGHLTETQAQMFRNETELLKNETQQLRDEAIEVAPSTWQDLRDETLVARDQTEIAKGLAQVAVQAAQDQGPTYDTITLGREAVLVDQTFKVKGNGDTAYAIYRNTGAAAQTPIYTMANLSAVERAALNAYRTGIWELLADGDPDQVPLTITEKVKVLTSQYKLGGQPVLTTTGRC